jgi:hypothetical protein
MHGDGTARRLFHEIEQFDGSSGALVAWVNMTNLASDQNTTFYMYYGNAECIGQEFSEKVWDNNYCGVWHLHEDPRGSISDSTINDNDGISYGAMTSSDLIEGKVGKCLDFDGDNDYIAIKDSSSLKPIDVTLVAWFKPREKNPPYGFFLSKKCYDYFSNADGHTYGFCWMGDNDTLVGGIEQDLISPDQWAKIGYYPILLNNWYYLVLTFNESSDVGSLYINGYEYSRKISLHISALWYNDPWDLLMGASRMHPGNYKEINEWFKCQLDEVRILDIPLAEEWIQTEYNNQNDPTKFLNIGNEETNL